MNQPSTNPKIQENSQHTNETHLTEVINLSIVTERSPQAWSPASISEPLHATCPSKFVVEQGTSLASFGKPTISSFSLFDKALITAFNVALDKRLQVTVSGLLSCFFSVQTILWS